MDILGKVKSALGVADETEQTDLFGLVVSHIKGQEGGLNTFIQQFKSKGLGNVVQSWVGTGQNTPITPTQLQDVLGSDMIKGIASKLGVDADTVTNQLTTLLPKVVDKLTPDGKVPEGDFLSKGIEKLGEFFGKK